MNSQESFCWIYFSLFTILILCEKSCGIDPKDVACGPKACGEHNISFPFYIKGQQEPFCGYPGFELSCDYGIPIIHIPDNDYMVEEILYKNHSLRLYIDDSLIAEDGCFSEIQNVTLSTDGRQFSYGPNVSELYLLSNCSTRLPGTLSSYRVGCGGGNGDEFGLAMFGNDTNLNAGLADCRRSVIAPVEYNGSSGVGSYQELLREGFVLNWKAQNCSICERSGGRCGFDSETNRVMCYCSDRPHLFHCSSKCSKCHSEKGGQCRSNYDDSFYCEGRKQGNHRKLVLKAGIAALAGGVVTLIILILCYRSKFVRKYLILWKKNEDELNVDEFLKKFGTLAPKRFCYAEIKKMTNSFKTKLGQGGYGSVYKGKLQNGNLVAVKVLNHSKGNGRDFINEISSIGRTSHVNIVSLLGFCAEGRKRALVYEYMANGSLEKFIYGKSLSMDHHLGWDKLYQIVIGIARGLEYLHRGCSMRILHFDIKPHNILLDKNFLPKISDFGLAKICSVEKSTISTLTARGTIGFIAPEVFNRNFGGVSHKSDVYSYGMMVLEMVGGRKNTDIVADRSSEIYFPEWIYEQLELKEELRLDDITNEEERKSARKMIIVSLWCIQANPSNRPSMSKVVEMLEGDQVTLEIPPKPFLYSPSRSPFESSIIEPTPTLQHVS